MVVVKLTARGICDQSVKEDETNFGNLFDCELRPMCRKSEKILHKKHLYNGKNYYHFITDAIFYKLSFRSGTQE